MPYKFGRNSLIRLTTACDSLQIVAKIVIKRSVVDFGIAFGHRDKALQNSLYRSVPKRTNKPWPLSKHNEIPSLAIDIFVYDSKLKKAVWDGYEPQYYYLYGMFDSVAKEQGYLFRFGANWDNDYEFLDQDLIDLPHVECVGKWSG